MVITNEAMLNGKLQKNRPVIDSPRKNGIASVVVLINLQLLSLRLSCCVGALNQTEFFHSRRELGVSDQDPRLKFERPGVLLYTRIDAQQFTARSQLARAEQLSVGEDPYDAVLIRRECWLRIAGIAYRILRGRSWRNVEPHSKCCKVFLCQSLVGFASMAVRNDDRRLISEVIVPNCSCLDEQSDSCPGVEFHVIEIETVGRDELRKAQSMSAGLGEDCKRRLVLLRQLNSIALLCHA